MAELARRYLVTGKVQGVGFRNYTAKKAKMVAVSGWVRNLDDGRVEALAVGTEEKLSHFEHFLRRGPMHAEVRDVEIFNEMGDFSEGEFVILW